MFEKEPNMFAKFDEEEWEEDGLHYKQIVGFSGVYLVVTRDGEIVRDDRPWALRQPEIFYS